MLCDWGEVFQWDWRGRRKPLGGVIPELRFKRYPGASQGVRRVTSWNPFSFLDVEEFSKTLAKWRWPGYPGWNRGHQDSFTILSPFYKVWWHLGWIWTDSEFSTPAPLARQRQTFEKEQVSVGGYITCLLKTPSWILNDNPFSIKSSNGWSFIIATLWENHGLHTHWGLADSPWLGPLTPRNRSIGFLLTPQKPIITKF